MFTKNAIHKYMDYDEQPAKALDLQSIRQACCFDPRWMFTILWRTWIVLHICLMLPKTKQQSKVLQSDNSYHKEFALVKGAEPFLQHDRDLLQDSQLWEVLVFQLPRKLCDIHMNKRATMLGSHLPQLQGTNWDWQFWGQTYKMPRDVNIAPFHQRMRVQQTRNESSLNDSIKLCLRSALFVYKQTHNHKTLLYEKVTIFYRFPEENERNRRENVGQNPITPSDFGNPTKVIQVIPSSKVPKSPVLWKEGSEVRLLWDRPRAQLVPMIWKTHKQP